MTTDHRPQTTDLLQLVLKFWSVVRGPLSVVLFLLLLLPTPLLAWSSHTHSLIAKESLVDVAKEWGLDQPVAITPFARFLEKLSKEKSEIKTREDFAAWLKINPSAKFDKPLKSEKGRTQITPAEILELYSPRADDWRDVHLPYDKEEQFWFGSGTKHGSQAFRHMEKPPFNPLHPLNTFGFPLGKIGQATQRAQIYFDLALLAYRLGEPYWAWNFLGCGLHYIEDLGQPYHTAQLLPPLLWEGLKGYLHFGLKEKRGFIPTVTHVVSNAHHYFEGYTDTFLSEQKDFGKIWIAALHGKAVLPPAATIQIVAKEVRDFSNRNALASVEATFKLTGDNLMTAKEYDGGGEERGPENPLPYLNPDSKERIAGAAQVSQIVFRAFEYEGKALRTVVRAFLNAIQRKGG